MNKGVLHVLAISLAAIILNGCMFGKLKEDIKIMQSVVGISGEVTNRSPNKQPLIILIYTEAAGQKQIDNFKIMDQDQGVYMFTVPDGEYYILAFEDANSNLVYDAGEYFGLFGRPDPIRVSGLIPKDDVNLEVDRMDGFPQGFPTDISNVKSLSDIKKIAAGTLTTLEDEKFSEENAKLGFWQPVTALYNLGAGIYFLEPYDPARIPVLFVHGASGSPRNFQTLAAHIDRDRFQAWFFHYPSGLPLEKVSRFLNNLVDYMHDTYRFDRLYVTAHSMGGLVSRGFILKNLYEDGHGYINLFVSISSPFGGLEAARKGVEKAPAAIPSWHDIVPASPFIEHIFSQPLKPKLDYYLLFSHKGDCSLFMDNNDGSVTLRSQLDMRAQADAVRIWGFDNGHVDILSRPEVLKIYNEILGRHAAKRRLVGTP
jgi:pimeloyl-ACP methyl ester carboxylesterase